MRRIWLGICWVGALGLFGYVFCWSAVPKEVERKPENVEILKKVAEQRLAQREAQYNTAMTQNNKGMACKFAREMGYWAGQTNDPDVIKISHTRVVGVCGYE